MLSDAHFPKYTILNTLLFAGSRRVQENVS